MDQPISVDGAKNKRATSEGLCLTDSDDQGCCFILTTAEADMPTRFCGAPTSPGSAYCPTHRILCVIVPRSAEADRAARQLERLAETFAPPPAELAFLAAIAVPEPAEEESADEVIQCLDVTPGHDDDEDE